MVLRFYRDGPVAVAGFCFWRTAYGGSGCEVAEFVGAKIPRSAYPKDRWSPDIEDLLPLEF